MALIPGIQQPLYVTVPNRDPAVQRQAKPVPPTACYVLTVGPVENEVALLTRVEAIVDALARDPRFAADAVSLRVIRWPVDEAEPTVLEVAERSEAPLTAAAHHELEDAFVVIEEDVKAHLYEQPLALFLTADIPPLRLLVQGCARSPSDSILSGLRVDCPRRRSLNKSQNTLL